MIFKIHLSGSFTRTRSHDQPCGAYTLRRARGSALSRRLCSSRGFPVSRHRPCSKPVLTRFPRACCSFRPVLLPSLASACLFRRRDCSESPLSAKTKQNSAHWLSITLNFVLSAKFSPFIRDGSRACTLCVIFPEFFGEWIRSLTL